MLLRRWKWIVALAVIAALAAAAVSFIVLEPSYEATALVLITRPRYQLRFDPRLETLSDIETASKAYPSLAMSDDLLQQVLEILNPPLPEDEQTLQALRSKVDASAGAADFANGDALAGSNRVPGPSDEPIRSAGWPQHPSQCG